MTKQQVIDILENFRPSRDKYCSSPVDDYVDDMIDSRIDSIIEFVKREPDNDRVWIKLSDRLPESTQQVLFYDVNHKDYAVGIYNKNYNVIQIGAGFYGIVDLPFTHWSALPDPPNCKNCKWHDDFSWVCSNGCSDECADFTDNNFYCEYWEEKE